MRNMSFAMTTPQVRERSKTVTRRLGWQTLKPGDLVQPVVKSMGLKKGEQVEKIGPPIRILNTRWEPLEEITQVDVALEGFPHWSTEQFIDFLTRMHHTDRKQYVNRIEFEYVG